MNHLYKERLTRKKTPHWDVPCERKKNTEHTQKKRTFIIGEEWLYYKLYCGVKTADLLLTRVIKPLTEQLLEEKRIDQWFFIRYSDPEPHLRIRFHCNDIAAIGNIINSIKGSIESYVNSGMIWKVQIDTYQREIERYGTNMIVKSEFLFYIDSKTCLNALSLIDDDELLFLFALRIIDSILHIFELSDQEKIRFTKNNLNQFKKEVGSSKDLSKQLYTKHQGLKTRIIAFMSMQTHEEYASLIVLFNEYEKKLDYIKEAWKTENIALNSSMEYLISDYIHMTVNRIFRDKQRLHELVCYDNLHRFYNYKLATNEK